MAVKICSRTNLNSLPHNNIEISLFARSKVLFLFRCKCLKQISFGDKNISRKKMIVLPSFSQPTDGIRHRQPNTTAYVNDSNLGKGTLYIAESQLSWICDSGNGFSLDYPLISLHAISRDLTAFPAECLFLMLDSSIGDDEEQNGDGEGEGDGDEENESDEVESGITQLRLVPDDRGMLDAMFHAMNYCQALHPDPEDNVSDEDLYESFDDDDVPMEETDSRMANLRIESMDATQHIWDRIDFANRYFGQGRHRYYGQQEEVLEGEGEVEREDQN